MREKRISELLEIDEKQVNRVLNESELSSISSQVINELDGHKNLIVGSSKKPFLKAEIFYTIVRLCQPTVVVETGVESGRSSALILTALEKNGRGKLYSIDLPDETLMKRIPPGERGNMSSGWVVPEKLRKRWDLIIGDSKTILPKLLDQLGEVDIFLHDGEHSYENMLFEYRLSWAHIKKGGYLLSDDIDANQALNVFSKDLKVRPVGLINSVAGIKKK
jgi:hypothetical protein